MKQGVLIWGYFASFILLLGAIFINLDFQAGKVLYLLGFFAFNIGYLIPLFLLLFKEMQENRIGIVLLFSIIGFFVFLTGVSFFMVSWGGGIVLIYIGGAILILAVFLLVILSRRFYETHIDSWFPILIFGVFIVISLLTSMVHRQVMRAFTLANKEEIELLNLVQKKNQILYHELIFLDTIRNNEFYLIKQCVDTISDLSNNLIEFIEEAKRDLIAHVEGDEYRLIGEKTLDNLVPVQSNVEINSVKRFMLGRKKGRAYTIRQRLEEYRNQMLSLISVDEPWLTEFISVSLNTQSYELSRRRYNRTWEFQHFYGFPLITNISQLTNIQLKIGMVQGELLNHYHKLALGAGQEQIPINTIK
jgi:hypothetical protein